MTSFVLEDILVQLCTALEHEDVASAAAIIEALHRACDSRAVESRSFMGGMMQDLSAWESVFAVTVFCVLAWIIGWRLVLALRVITQGDDTRHDVMALLGRVASEMATQPPGQEAEEVAYLLEALGHRVDRDTYRQVLEAVQGDIAVRLQAVRP
jgi:hypothetical protein